MYSAYPQRSSLMFLCFYRQAHSHRNWKWKGQVWKVELIFCFISTCDSFFLPRDVSWSTWLRVCFPTFSMDLSQEDYSGCWLFHLKGSHYREIRYSSWALHGISLDDPGCRREEHLPLIRTAMRQGNNSQLQLHDLTFIMKSILFEHLWGHVLWTTAERISSLSTKKGFRQSKISNSDMSITSNQKILWFEVSIDYFFGMKMIQPNKYFQKIKLRLRFSHPFDLF